MRYDMYNRVDLEHMLERQRPVIEAAEAWDYARLAEAKAVTEPEEIWAAKHYALRKAETALTVAVRDMQAARGE
jgi:hypothetical protein